MNELHERNEFFKVNEIKLTYKSKEFQTGCHQLNDSQIIYKFLKDYAFDPETIEYRESFKLLLLTRSLTLIGLVNISEGGISETIADVKMILQAALLSNACNIVICHNHPSSNINPSSQDDSITKQIKEASKVMGINLIDHLIICPKNYYSFADEGRL